eukprot:TRINITY_DN25745_c0_g1_i1.p1 TRINITY_DN25745_c0_g1~~TRINITY_DN25745_c0_g1_i1.p1  ORF type:complete len:360 (-),score=138.71 TRINITY_DN25745_c0_g1_i1:274-1353(-)
MTVTCLKLTVQHTLLDPEPRRIRIPIAPESSFAELGRMLLQRLSIKLPVGAQLRFITESGDDLSTMDTVGDLVEERELLVAKLHVSAAPVPVFPAFQEVHIGMVAPAVEPMERKQHQEVAPAAEPMESDQELAPAEIVAIPSPRPSKKQNPKEMKVHNPTRISVDVPRKAFGAVIGVKGKTIQALQKKFDAKVELDTKVGGAQWGRCAIKADSASNAKKAEGAVRKIIRNVELAEKHEEKEAKLSAVRELTEEEARAALAVQKQIKGLHQKLKRIEAIKQRMAAQDPWVERTEQEMLARECQYLEQLETLTSNEQLPERALRQRLQKADVNVTESRALEKEFQWHGKKVVAVVDLSRLE